MKGETFEKAVVTRAKQRVDDKLRVFRKALVSAMRELVGRHSVYLSDTLPKQVLAILAGGTPTLDWPASLWRDEEDRVRKELFAVMDEMQKALIAKPPVGDDVCLPEEDQTAE